ncbi:MAG: hypothetical protein HY290_16110, partial [Planctomycetia bacterium]|nr:hypothetical protein [Planctomycetia bacterium]
WPAVPALALFLPKSDCLFPLLAMTFVWRWLQGVPRRSRWLSALAGLVMWLSLSLSLAFLPVGLIAVLAVLWTDDGAQPGLEGSLIGRNEPPVAVGWLRPALRRLLPPCASAVAVISAMTVAVWWLARLNLILVWKLNLANHAGFYRQFSRTYWKWILLNPVEFAVAAGFPLVALAAWSLVRNSRRAGLPSRGYAGAWLLTIALLWLSGKNMGEAARLWIFLIPFLPWIAAPLFEGGVLPADKGGSLGQHGSIADPPDSKAIWPVALGLQLVSTAWLVTQVAGFHLPQAVPVVANLPAP